MDITQVIFIILFGLIIGSFLSVCIFRLPIGRFDALDDDGEAVPSDKEKMSIFYPTRSFCPSCKNNLRWYHNIPVLSWLVLRGKCSFCKTKISFRYPLVEIISAIFAFLSFYFYGATLEGFIIYAFCAVLIVLSFIDIDYFILPNIITYPVSIIGIILVSFNHFFHFLNFPFCGSFKCLFLGLLGALFLYLIGALHGFIRKKEGLGFGDIKLLIMIGVFFGLPSSFYTIFLGSILAIIGTIIIAIFKKNSLSEPLPFGPYLSLGCVLYLFYFSFSTIAF
ncbi:MAG: prepilin peptidase [Bdellovibrionota bacterium]